MCIRDRYKTFLALLNPFAPHITEELWQQLGETGLLSVAPWPTYDEAKTVESTVELAVQVNGKLKCTIKLAADADKQTAIDTAMAEEKVQHAIEGKQIVKQIVVPGKIVNLSLIHICKGEFIEVQGTGEGRPFTDTELRKLLGLGKRGCLTLCRKQAKVMGESL